MTLNLIHFLFFYKDNYSDFLKIIWGIVNPLASPGEGVTVFTYPYLSAGAPALGEAKGLIDLYKFY